MEYSDLPLHIFEEIVKDCSWNELKALSTVCRGWNSLIDQTIFWSRKLQLDTSYVNCNILEQSVRHYENLYISSRVKLSKVKKILKILQERDLFQKNSIKSLKISHQKVTNVIEILLASGKDLNELDIIFKENEKVNIPSTEITSLNSVKILRVTGSCEHFSQFYVNFKSLKELRYSVPGNAYETNFECLRKLVCANKSSLRSVEIYFRNGFKGCSLKFLENIEYLQNLSIVSQGTAIEIQPDLIRKPWSLHSLTLNTCILTNENLRDIIHNYKSLKHLTLGFDSASSVEPETIHQIWNLPQLESLEYTKLEIPNEYSFMNSTNKNIKTLSLKNIRLCLNFCKMFPQRAPSLEYLKIIDKHYREQVRFELMEKLQQLSFLKVLDLNFSFQFQDHTKYSMLEELSLGKFCNDIMIDWSNLEAPNLKTLNLNDCSSWTNVELDKCLSNLGTITSLHVKHFKSCDKTVDILSNKSPHLENLKFGFMNWEQLLNLLRKKPVINLKFVEMDFSKIDFFCLNEGMVEEISDILKTQIRLCNSDDNLHFGDCYTLFGDLIEIKLLVLPEREET